MAKVKIPKINVGEFPYADILPQSRKDTIDRAEAKAKWIRIFIGSSIATVALVTAAFGFQIFSQIQSTSATDELNKTESQIAQFKETDTALTARDGVIASKNTASAAQIVWQDLYSRVNSHLPETSYLTSYTANVGGITLEENAVAVQITIAAKQPIDYADVVNSFSPMPGIQDIQVGNMYSSGTDPDIVYMYDIAFYVDSSVLVSYPALKAALEGNKETDAANTEESTTTDEKGAVAEELDKAEDAVDGLNNDTADTEDAVSNENGDN